MFQRLASRKGGHFGVNRQANPRVWIGYVNTYRVLKVAQEPHDWFGKYT